MEEQKTERLLRVIVSMLLWMFGLGVAVLMIEAYMAMPANIDAHVVRYLLQAGFILVGALSTVVGVCSLVWDYVNGK